jgi:hypothetical protein
MDKIIEKENHNRWPTSWENGVQVVGRSNRPEPTKKSDTMTAHDRFNLV